MGLAGGFEWAENTHLTTTTRGAANAAYTTAVVANQNTGTSLVVAAGAGVPNAGDVFTIAGVYRCHPETKISSGVLQQFVVVGSYAGGAGTMTISPGINGVSGSPSQNVVTTANASAALTFAGTASTATGLSLAFHPDAFTFATADLVMPGGVDMASGS